MAEMSSAKAIENAVNALHDGGWSLGADERKAKAMTAEAWCKIAELLRDEGK